MEQLAQRSTVTPNLEQRDLSNAADRGEKPTRRRSHRPRGCRGGSNRRKNKGAENRGSFNKSKKELTKKHQGSFKNQRSSFNKGSNASEVLATNNTSNIMGQQQPGAYEYDKTLTLQEYGLSGADAFYSSEYYSSASDLYPSGTDLQESLSESSEEGIPNPNSRSFHFDPSDSGILPPMAVKKLQESEPVTFRGPNPYALHPSTSQNVAGDFRLPEYGMYNHNGNDQDAEAHKMNFFHNNHGHVYSENSAYAGLLALQLPALESKMNHPVIKQQPLRQVRGGGSLFCTSPRSFLMGSKKIDVSRSE